MIPRLFIDAPLACGKRAVADGAQAHYLLRALRLGNKAPLAVFNGEGGQFAAHIARVDGKRVEIEIGEFSPDRAPRLSVHLGQGIFESGKMDWALEKITELGAASFEPLICRENAALCRGLKTSRGAQAASSRWRRVAIAACQQCGRTRLPRIAPARLLGEWLKQIPADATRLLFTPANGKRLTELRLATPVYALIGPRAGLTAEEENAARAAGFAPVTMGPRILRVETAGIAAIAALQTLAGDLA
jgi:16S rRNA (uracil1498-N3)-methyltransferase